MGIGSDIGVSIGSGGPVGVITFSFVAVVGVSLVVAGTQPVIINIRHIALTANIFASLAWRKHAGVHAGKDASTASFKCILLAI